MAIIKPFKHHNNHQIATSPIGEVFRIMAGKNLVPLKYQDTLITFDKTNNLVNLKQLWKAANSPKGKEPPRWLKLDQSAEFIFVLEKKLNVNLNDILKTVPGRGGGTWGHWQIALAYAKYLDPDLHIQVNEWARRYVEEEIEPEKGVDRSIKNWKRQGKSDQWIQTRLENKQVRHQLTSTLQQHGVSQSFHYANCTNAIYQEVLGGTAQQLKEKNGLAKKASLRDNLSRVEVAALGLAEALAEEDIQENQRYGFQQCLQSCDNAGGKVKRALS
ncbi:KilA-N domain-containing protein [Planktothrix agardhii 1029]|nr:KilA-N domain-containing protein [Planktothrix agardhii]MCB8766611.1 KilA-N domain-containing protein [Planktothrix agardhii 1809]MCB8780165.1 KilA-N domain-containing protein [Planktothrix agardhii 1031]MCB8784538.1 KilA-N domain-containing protein [Planktothrix agardhii 1808]MCF3568812.1 KilA-N domain-containing protein [Planktothrix agardhii 1807]MCF3592256.1 KilA-N domain-containing protein [Planktothrix agardhii 1029]